jgi:hypothetical protein
MTKWQTLRYITVLVLLFALLSRNVNAVMAAPSAFNASEEVAPAQTTSDGATDDQSSATAGQGAASFASPEPS